MIVGEFRVFFGYFYVSRYFLCFVSHTTGECSVTGTHWRFCSYDGLPHAIMCAIQTVLGQSTICLTTDTDESFTTWAIVPSRTLIMLTLHYILHLALQISVNVCRAWNDNRVPQHSKYSTPPIPVVLCYKTVVVRFWITRPSIHSHFLQWESHHSSIEIL